MKKRKHPDDAKEIVGFSLKSKCSNAACQSAHSKLLASSETTCYVAMLCTDCKALHAVQAKIGVACTPSKKRKQNCCSRVYNLIFGNAAQLAHVHGLSMQTQNRLENDSQPVRCRHLLRSSMTHISLQKHIQRCPPRHLLAKVVNDIAAERWCTVWPGADDRARSQ